MTEYRAPESIRTFRGRHGHDLVRAVISCNALIRETYGLFTPFPDMDRMPSAMAFLARLTAVMRSHPVETDPYCMRTRCGRHGTAWTYQSACVVIRCARREPSTRRQFPWIGPRIASATEFQDALRDLEDAALHADLAVAMAEDALPRLDPIFRLRWTTWGHSRLNPRGVQIVPRMRTHWSPERWTAFWTPAASLLDRAWLRCEGFLERLEEVLPPPQQAIPCFPDGSPMPIHDPATAAAEATDGFLVVPDSGMWDSAHLPVWFPPFPEKGASPYSLIWPEARPSTPLAIIAGGACALSHARPGLDQGSAASERMVRGIAAAIRWATCAPTDRCAEWQVSGPGIALVDGLRRHGTDVSAIRHAAHDLLVHWTPPPIEADDDPSALLDVHAHSILSLLQLHVAAGGAGAAGIPALLLLLRRPWIIDNHGPSLRAVHRFLTAHTALWSHDTQLARDIGDVEVRFQRELGSPLHPRPEQL